MHIVNVKTNAKVGADVTIGPKTLIVGRNGSGKSTVINAIELALTSRVSDVAGRTDIAREADVMSLAPAGEKTLFAQVTFDTGEAAAYTVTGSTAKAKKASVVHPHGVDPDTVLPIRTLKEAVLGSAATARKYLLAQIAGGVTRADIADLMPNDETKAQWIKQVGIIAPSISAPDALVMVLERAGTVQREETARAKTSREAAKIVGGGRAAPPSKKEIAAATEKRDAARAAWSDAQNREKPWPTIDETEINAVVQMAESAVTAHAMAQGKLANTEKPQPPHPAFPAIATVMEASLVGNGSCLACGTGQITSDDLAFVRDSLTGYDAAVRAYAALQAEVAGLDTTAQKLIEKVEKLEAQKAAADEHNAGIGTDSVDLVALKADLDAAESALTDLKVVADAWASARKAESTATEADALAETWKAFKTACEDAVGIVLNQALAAFVARVQSFLPQTDTFDLRLTDGEREVVQFGLSRDGHLHTALSGAEWARVMAAMAEACTPAGDFGVLIPEERAFDADTLAEVMEAFNAVTHQVVLASPVLPAYVPAGWTVVERGGAA